MCAKGFALPGFLDLDSIGAEKSYNFIEKFPIRSNQWEGNVSPVDWRAYHPLIGCFKTSFAKMYEFNTIAFTANTILYPRSTGIEFIISLTQGCPTF